MATTIPTPAAALGATAGPSAGRVAAHARRGYLKSVDFPIHMMVVWWLIWITLSISPLTDFLKPSWATIAQYLFLIVAFLCGHAFMRWFRPFNCQSAALATRGMQTRTWRVRWALWVCATGCLALLVLSLKLAGAFENSFVEYFIRTRLAFAESSEPTLTGVHALDVLTKVFAYPISYSMVVMLLSIDLVGFRRLFLLCLANILCFAYLWQVNYPFIHLFWFMVFYTLLTAQRRGYFNKKILIGAGLVFVGLIASAANRFGGDVLGGFQRYIVDYHLVGFSFYDHQYLDPNSVLHSPSYGRSSLGFVDHLLEAALKPLQLGYRAASFETGDALEQGVDIGANESMTFNAFGTILFSLYRDFDLPGIFLGGFVYGAAVTYLRYRSANSWRAGALFLMMASAWMVGMMVSPLEEVYFWFTILTVGIFGLVNRGVHWRKPHTPSHALP